MKMKMEDGWLYIIEADMLQTQAIKSLGMKWKRKDRMWYGRVSRELLNRLSSLLPSLPQQVEAERVRLNGIQAAVDAERTLPGDELKPLVKFPVTKGLYEHQVRAANMALLTFGVVDSGEVLHGHDE